VRVKGLSVLAIPLVSLLAVVGASLALQLQEREQRREAIQAGALTTAAGAVLSDALDAESGMRGYAGTNDPLFLQPYTAALSRLPADLIALRQAAAAEGDSARVEVLAATVTDAFARLATLHDSVGTGSSGVALAQQLRAGRSAMDRLRGQIAGLVAEPSRLAQQRRDAIGRIEARIRVVDVAGLGVGVLAGLLGIALFALGISRRLATAADNADRLGDGRPLRPTAPAGDELGRLAESIIRADQLLTTRRIELTAARDEALNATRVKNTFLSRTSHELRTPLNAILGFAQLLEMSELGEDDQDSTARILIAGRHLLALINELIDIARIEAGDLKLSVEPVALALLADEVLVLMHPLAAARSITISQHCPSPTLAARADRQRLKQILINLISNAVKYNRDRGTIDVVCRRSDGDLVDIAIIDSGPGLSAQEIEQIFVPFERLRADQHGIEGTGIGLPLALSLTEAMHGELAVTSSAGHGSTFTVRLPQAPDIVPAAVTGPPRRAPRRPAPVEALDPATVLHVLSIEDNPANSHVLDRFLASRSGTTLVSTSSGADGISLAQLHLPDLILLDLHLPDLPGEEVFTRLRAEPATAGIPIIVLSADATPGTVRRLLARGASAYLTKPLDLQELGSALDAVTRQPPVAGPLHPFTGQPAPP
jgi:signal transduction histidine kinase/ActR/RegA family two-component response regulator